MTKTNTSTLSLPANWRPEILAPAGAPDCLPAAVAGGANAVYLGLRHFNARGRAENFRVADLPEHLSYLHDNNLKAYLVLNTLLHDDEFNKAIDMAGAASRAGIDAVLVQDLGLWHCLRRYLPDLELHASTQMTVHCRSQIEQLAALGAQRIVLARELRIEEVTDLTAYAASLGVETEHFVHGALCYAFSGQCLMSNFSGCRSANRGTCAQNCRYDYQTNSDKTFDTHISMKDLSLIDAIPALARAGVASLKIEGRLKGPDYVYTVAQAFKKAVDAWQQQRAFTATDVQFELQRVFSRGATSAPVDGIYDQRSRLSRSQQDRAADAIIVRVHRQRGEVLLRSKQEPIVGCGYGVNTDQFRDGFLITTIQKTERRHEWLCQVRMQKNGPHIPSATPAFLNSDQAYKQQVEAAVQAAIPKKAQVEKIPLHIQVRGSVQQVMQVTVHCAGQTFEFSSEEVLLGAQQRAIDEAQLQKTLLAFGTSAYQCTACENALSGSLFLSAKQLKQLRRDIVAYLDQQDLSVAEVEEVEADAQLAAAARDIVAPQRAPDVKRTEIFVVVSRVEAVYAALAAGADKVCLDDPCLDLWAETAPNLKLPIDTYLRHPPTRSLSPHLQALGHPVLAGHIGVFESLRSAGLDCVADHYCNVVNTHTLESLAEMGISAAVLSLECSAREIAKLATRSAQRALPGQILTVHGRLPSMLTRQDHGLAAGELMHIQSHKRDGGLSYEIQRRLAEDTVIWEARRLMASEAVLLTNNLVDAWLLELGDCSNESIATFTTLYRRLRDGELVHQELRQAARQHYQHPTFEGHLETGSRAFDQLQAAAGDA